MVLWTGVLPSGRGLPPLDGGNGPVLCPEPPSCAPNPRHDPRTRVQASRAERGVGVIGDAAPSASAWSPPRGASCTGGRLQHRGVRWERIRRCSAQQQCEAQPPVLRAPDETADRTIDPSASRHQNQQKTSYMPRHARSGEALAEPSKAPGDRLKHLQTVLSIP